MNTDIFPTIIEVFTDTDGTKYVHFLGYRMVEYTGFVVSLKEALKYGILKFEGEFSDQYKQYIGDCSEEELQAIYRGYDNDHAPEKIKLCDISMTTPDGMYSVDTEA